MAKGSTAARGRFVWNELMTTDVDAAKAFYQSVIGWNPHQWEWGGSSADVPPEYTVWMAGERPVGGVMTLPPEVARNGVPPHWMAYVEVPDVDETAAEATRTGGTIHMPPKAIPEVGRFAVIGDPQGAVFMVITSETPPEEPETEPGPLDFCWPELYTTDWPAADRFYSQLLGWTKQGDVDMGPMGNYHMFGRGDFRYGGMMNKPSDMADVPPHWIHYVRVDDVDAVAARAEQHGGRILHGPMDVPGGDRVALVADPQGAAFGLHAFKGKAKGS